MWMPPNHRIAWWRTGHNHFASIIDVPMRLNQRRNAMLMHIIVG
jgi:hypothetical protein